MANHEFVISGHAHNWSRNLIQRPLGARYDVHFFAFPPWDLVFGVLKHGHGLLLVFRMSFTRL